MPTTLRNTDILFNDGSTQSTAAALVPSSYGAVGTIVLAMVQISSGNSALAEGSTIAGSNLRRWPDGPINGNFIRFINGLTVSTSDGTMSVDYFWANLVSLGLSGTWRTLTRGRYSGTFNPTDYGYLVLLQRIS